MKLLSIDTTGPHCAAALIEGTAVHASRTEEMEKGQAERLFPMLAEMLAEESWAWADLDLMAVATGPGNFTGVRIGVSAARGLALSLRVQCRGVSILEALAFGHAGSVLALADGRRERLYAQNFSDGVKASDANLITYEGVGARAQKDTRIVGYSSGTLATRHGRSSIDAPDHPTPDTIGLAALAAGPSDVRPAPLYIRDPDASPSTDPVPRIIR